MTIPHGRRMLALAALLAAGTMVSPALAAPPAAKPDTTAVATAHAPAPAPATHAPEPAAKAEGPKAADAAKSAAARAADSTALAGHATGMTPAEMAGIHAPESAHAAASAPAPPAADGHDAAPATPAAPAPAVGAPAAAAATPAPDAAATAAHAHGGPGSWVTENDTTLFNQPAAEDIQLQVNADVLKWIEFFTGAGRSTFEKWMKRSGRYMELFRTVLQREGLPPDLVHLVFVESGFNLNARSYARAVGPWQFVKSSARLFGLNVNQWVDERKDPEKSTVAAARYLKHLFGIFGDWPLALAAYNAGEGTVLRAIRRQGTTNYWDLRLPRQTEDYVPQFMAALAITRDPARYGFSDVQLDDPMRFDEVTLRGSVDLRALARLADCPYEELKDLNPAIRASAVRGADGVVSVRVPQGRSEIIQQRLREGAQLPAVNLTVRHRVQHGETLRSIAAEFSVNARDLARANGISRRQPLRRGMMLTVPASLHAPRPEMLDGPDPRASTAYVPPRRIGLPVQIQGDSREHDRATHVVRRGQTLYIIGQLYGVTPEQLKEWNHLRTNALRPGMRLRVRLDQANDAVATRPDSLRRASAAAGDTSPVALAPASAAHDSAIAAQLAPLAPRVHVVRRGETLTSIATTYGVTRHDLRAWNHLRSSRLHRGQHLRLVPAPGDAADPDAVAAGPVAAGPVAAGGAVVTVQPGQTLSQIAAEHRVSVRALRHANGLRTSRIRAGQHLRLPA